MSEAMIVRRGGAKKLQERIVTPSASEQIITPEAGFGGISKVTVNGDANLVEANIKEGVAIFGKTGTFGGFNTAGAILKVITSSGCTVTIQNGSYVKTQQTGEGFVRSGDANVEEHFFSIPASAFGTFTVTVSKVYSGSTLTNSKTIVVDTVDRVYEIAVAAPNIILNSTFGLQSGYSVDNALTYNDRSKRIERNSGTSRISGPVFSNDIPVSAFDSITVTASSINTSHASSLYLLDADYSSVANMNILSGGPQTVTSLLSNKYYPTAILYESWIHYIAEIVLN